MFHNERGLFNNVAFRRDENLVNEVGIPLFSGVVKDNFIDSLDVILIVPWGKNFISILPSNPIVLPYVYMLTISHLPTTALFYSVNSMIDALPCIAIILTLMSMKNIRIGVVFCL
jgi:hypothetical protein